MATSRGFSNGPLADAMKARLRRTQAVAATELQEAQNALLAARSELRDCEGQLQNARLQLQTCTADAEGAHAQVQSLSEAAEQAHARAQHLNAKCQSLSESEEHLRAELAKVTCESKEKCQKMQAKEAELQQEVQSVNTRLQVALFDAENAAAARHALEARLQETLQELEEIRKKPEEVLKKEGSLQEDGHEQSFENKMHKKVGRKSSVEAKRRYNPFPAFKLTPYGTRVRYRSSSRRRKRSASASRKVQQEDIVIDPEEETYVFTEIGIESFKKGDTWDAYGCPGVGDVVPSMLLQEIRNDGLFSLLLDHGDIKLQGQPLTRYLPKSVRGVVALVECGYGHWLVDNSRLPSEVPLAYRQQSHGLCYRVTKSLSDIDNSRFAAYGSTVQGFDEGDWVKVELEVKEDGNMDSVSALPKHGTASSSSGHQGR